MCASVVGDHNCQAPLQLNTDTDTDGLTLPPNAMGQHVNASLHYDTEQSNFVLNVIVGVAVAAAGGSAPTCASSVFVIVIFVFVHHTSGFCFATFLQSLVTIFRFYYLFFLSLVNKFVIPFSLQAPLVRRGVRTPRGMFLRRELCGC